MRRVSYIGLPALLLAATQIKAEELTLADRVQVSGDLRFRYEYLDYQRFQVDLKARF